MTIPGIGEEMTGELLRRRIMRRLRCIVRELEENISTIEWWNANRTDTRPIDCEGDRVLLAVTRRLLMALKSGNRGDLPGLVADFNAAVRVCESENRDHDASPDSAVSAENGDAAGPRRG